MENDDFASQEFNTEQFFDEFVESIGGELIKKRFNKPPSFNNADYLFQATNVIVELKSLKMDFTVNSLKREKKLQQIFDNFCESGQVTTEMISNPELLPADFVFQTLKLLKPPLQNILEKANKQIKSTKKELGLENAKGLVIIFNDGFYALTPNRTIAVIGDILRNLYPTIEGFVYVTLRKRIDIPNDKHRRIVLLPTYREANNVVLSDFVNWLGERWFNYLEEISGGKFLSKVIDHDPANKHIKNAEFE